MYYLEDNTLHVTEPREENSGFPQGTFLRRGKVYKRDGVTLISPADFVVGEFVEFYGRRYVIVDCDAFSRSWFKERGIEQPEAISYPEDRYCKQLEERKVREGRDTSVNYGKLLNPNKVYMEARLGKFSHDSNKASQFFANDRKVLRFYCVWNEAVEIFGIKQYYKLNYFLADDTVEVRETQDPNCGKDPFACLLRRQKLPRRWEEEMSRAREGLDASGDAYVKAVELRVGGMVNVYGRQLEIYDADEFTREYFRTEIGVELAPALPRPCPSEQRPSSPPPFNG